MCFSYIYIYVYTAAKGTMVALFDLLLISANKQCLPMSSFTDTSSLLLQALLPWMSLSIPPQLSYVILPSYVATGGKKIRLSKEE